MICIELKDGDLIRIPENKKLRLHKSVFNDVIRFKLYDATDSSEEFYLLNEYQKGEKYLAYNKNGESIQIDYITAAELDFELLKNIFSENENVVVMQDIFHEIW